MRCLPITSRQNAPTLDPPTAKRGPGADATTGSSLNGCTSFATAARRVPARALRRCRTINPRAGSSDIPFSMLAASPASDRISVSTSNDDSSTPADLPASAIDLMNVLMAVLTSVPFARASASG